MNRCNICPHQCNIDRDLSIGRCNAGSNIKIALASIHNYEEPCISGSKGSGTIFFSNCNLKCKYCQNYTISQQGYGKEITIKYLSEIFLRYQEKNIHNVNLVSPTIYATQIIEAIKLAREKGFSLPIIYNSSGYEKVETIKALKGYIDVYLPDFKYYYNELGVRYSQVNNYFEIATEAIKEMYKQVGIPKLNQEGIIQKGLIIRHMILPNNIENSKQILKWIKNNIDNEVYVSIMAQYFPTYFAKQDDTINRKINKKEYKEIEKYLFEINLENGYIQELGEHEEEYVPNFNLDEI